MNLHANVLRGIVGLAMHKRIGKGRPEAILQRLEYFASDIEPSARLFFSRIFALGTVTAEKNQTPRALGAMFWENAGRDRDEVRRIGSFYTPEPVVDRILDLVWKDIFPNRTEERTVCDPAVGCGFFLLRLTERRARQVGMAAVREWAGRRLYGVDSDPAAVFMARAMLWLAMSDRRGEFVPRLDAIRVGDSLLGPAFGTADKAAPENAICWNKDFPGPAGKGGFDVILGNPPYEVLTNFSRHPERAALANALRQSGYYHDSLGGQINLYRCFIERSLDLLAGGGALSFIVPLSLTRDAAALQLRERLVDTCAATQWHLFGERDALFPGVTQSACIFRAVKNGGPGKTLRFHSGGGSFSLKTSVLRRAGPGFCFPGITADEAAFWLSLREKATVRLGDICAMRVGEVDQTVYGACMADQDTGCVLARGAHLSPFRLDATPVPGKARFLREDAFLKMKGKAASACRERARSWRVVQLGIRNAHSRPRLVAALAEPGIYPGNSLNVYFPNAGVSLAYLAGLLNSALLDWLFCASSGNNNINLCEMRILPVPASPAAAEVAAVEKAYNECARQAEAGGDVEHARTALDAAVGRCYGLALKGTSITNYFVRRRGTK